MTATREYNQQAAASPGRRPVVPEKLTLQGACARRGRVVARLVFLVLLQLHGGLAAAEHEDMSFVLASSAFEDGGPIPARYTCDGGDIAPPLHWKGVPAGARSLVLIVDDPDAPDPTAVQMTWVHWVLYNIPPATTALPESGAGADVPFAAGSGLNDWHRTGYGGPCPPLGRHRYFFKLYALDTTLEFSSKPTKADVMAAMEKHVLGRAWMMGTYRKQQ